MASDRRARKRERKQQQLDADQAEAMRAYAWTRIVCDRCGLDQPFRSHAWGTNGELAPCDGPLGIPCNSETAVFLDAWEEWYP